MRGVRIYGRVFIGDDVYLENEYPECVEIHDGAEIGLRSIIIAHTRGAGEVVIGKDVLLGAGVIVVCPARRKLVIGEGAVITAGSVVTTNVDPFTLCGGSRISARAKITVPFTMDTQYDEFVRGLRPIRKVK
jgi:acetyltransferase-like isoleucine patch superfamily enzyme